MNKDLDSKRMFFEVFLPLETKGYDVIFKNIWR